MSHPEHSEILKQSARSSNRRSILALVLMLLVVVIAPMSLGRTHMPVPFDQSVADSFDNTKADVVFLGNSLLDTRIDADYLGELIGDNVESLAIDGTGPGIWLLQLANIVAAAEKIPEQIFVFFHDDLLTRPIYFTGEKYLWLKESLSHSSIGGPGSIPGGWLPEQNKSFTDRMKGIFHSLYPIADAGSSRNSNPISSIGARIVGMSDRETEESTENIFGFATKREQTARIQQPKYHGTFDSMIGESFLPYLLELGAALDSEMIFVRLAARPNDNGSPNEPDSLTNYSADLDAYLTARNVRYVDMSGHVESGDIDAAMYYDGYHLKNRFRQTYTEFFAEWMLASNHDKGTTP